MPAGRGAQVPGIYFCASRAVRADVHHDRPDGGRRDPRETMPWASGRAAFNRVVQVMQQGIGAGVFHYPDAKSAALMVWSQVHGMAALFLRKRLMIFPEERRHTIMEEAMTLFMKVLEHGLQLFCPRHEHCALVYLPMVL